MFSLSFLTAATDPSLPVSSIITGVILVLILAAGIALLYSNAKKKNILNEEIEKFLNVIRDSFKNRIIEILSTVEIDSKASLFEAEQEFLQKIYDDAYDYVIGELDKLYGENQLYKALKKLLDKEKINQYVLSVMSDKDIQDKLIEIYNIAISKQKDEIDSYEKEALDFAEEIESDNTPDEESSIPKLDPTRDTFDPEQEINPPVEEETNVVSADDESIEIIDDPQTR